MAEPVPARLTLGELRKFGLTLGGAGVAIGLVLFWRGAVVGASVSGALGGLLVIAGMALPESLRNVERGWMRFAHALSRVTTPIVMGVLFFLVITPIGVIRRATGRRPLVHGAPGGSAWITRSAAQRRSDLTRQF